MVEADLHALSFLCSELIEMSRAHEPNQPFFPFGNPFRRLSPKGSQLSRKVLLLLNNFEEALAERLRNLIPKDKSEVLSLSWMKLAMNSLCHTHNDIKTLITELELPVSDWDEKWIDVYLDISVNLLDICIAFSSELSRLNQCNLLLQCVLHNLDSTSSKVFNKARSSLDDWRQHISSNNPRVENCYSILRKLMESLDLPKVKNSAKGKVLMHAMYGVKVQTVFICAVFVAAFSGSAEKLTNLRVAEKYKWAQAFTSLQTSINGEMGVLFSGGKFSVLPELESVDLSVKKLYPLIQDGVDPVEAEAFHNSVSDLRKRAEKLSQGLDLLTKEVDSFFQIILTGRDALLGNLRVNGTMTDASVKGNIVEQLVR